MFSHPRIWSLVPIGDGLAILGADDCDEGGRFPFLIVLGKTERELTPPSGLPALGAIAVAGEAVIIATPTLQRSTDSGKTWKASGRTEAIAALATVGDVVIGVGGGGTILRSTDAGKAWTLVASGTKSDLVDVSGAGDTLFAVGGDTILASRDAGKTWTESSKGRWRGLQSVWTTSADQAIVVGAGVVLRTRDGKTWRRRETWKAVGGQVSRAWGAGDDVYVAGERALVSRDAGETWKPLAGLGELASRIAGRSADDIYAIGFGLLHSSDRGKTWTHVGQVGMRQQQVVGPHIGRRCI